MCNIVQSRLEEAKLPTPVKHRTIDSLLVDLAVFSSVVFACLKGRSGHCSASQFLRRCSRTFPEKSKWLVICNKNMKPSETNKDTVVEPFVQRGA